MDYAIDPGSITAFSQKPALFNDDAIPFNAFYWAKSSSDLSE